MTANLSVGAPWLRAPPTPASAATITARPSIAKAFPPVMTFSASSKISHARGARLPGLVVPPFHNVGTRRPICQHLNFKAAVVAQEHAAGLGFFQIDRSALTFPTLAHQRPRRRVGVAAAEGDMQEMRRPRGGAPVLDQLELHAGRVANHGHAGAGALGSRPA